MNFDLASALEVLERTPATLRAMLGGLPDCWTKATEGAGTWSPYDVVGHLLHTERTDWLVRARLILAQGPNRTFTPLDREAQFHASAARSLNSLLDHFAAAREANLATIRGWGLKPAHLALTAEHPVIGTVTLEQLIAAWVAHDLAHLAQIARVMAKQYRDEVGPWRQYLGILDR